jgi:signal transduction histidine kinase
VFVRRVADFVIVKTKVVRAVSVRWRLTAIVVHKISNRQERDAFVPFRALRPSEDASRSSREIAFEYSQLFRVENKPAQEYRPKGRARACPFRFPVSPAQMQDAPVTFRSAVFALSLAAPLHAADWLGAFYTPLRQEEEAAVRSRSALRALGDPVVGNTVPEFGIQHKMRQEPPPVPPYVQVDLGEVQALDAVVLVPAAVDFGAASIRAYAFPPRFRLDASDTPNFHEFKSLWVQTESDLQPQGIAPIRVPTLGLKARYLRLTITKLAQVDGFWTYALAELLALQGNRNVAQGAAVKQTDGIELPPRWSSVNFTDGRSPLGPPLRPGSPLPTYDALFAKPGPDSSPAWMAVDLGSSHALEEIRLHPLHARQGADVPGFRFPLQFRIDVADDPSMEGSQTAWDSQGRDFSNPGNNPVTLPLRRITGRYVRFVALKLEKPGADSFALSEMQVYADGKNVAHGRPVSSSGDAPRNRPLQDLTDGCASFGELEELPLWLATWELRGALQKEIAAADARLPQLQRSARSRAFVAGGVGLVVVAALGAAWMVRSARRQKRELERFRAQLARDMHDEVGSNLAGIAVISELWARQNGPEQADWADIHRIARETTDAMREVLWTAGARQETGIDLPSQLQKVAARLLSRQTVHWSLQPGALQTRWEPEAARQIFLFFKETLANLVRHATASHVNIALCLNPDSWVLTVSDDGRGFDPKNSTDGIGLVSLRARARSLDAAFDIRSQPGTGTCLELRVPLKKSVPRISGVSAGS